MSAYARQAITTRYAGPTDHRGSRVIATTGSGLRKIVPWDHALNVASNHAAAARLLAVQLGWAGVWHMGGTRDGYAFVCGGSTFRVDAQVTT